MADFASCAIIDDPMPPGERALLAQDIIARLDGPTDAGAAEAWVREIKHRVREVNDGSVKLIGGVLEENEQAPYLALDDRLARRIDESTTESLCS